MILAVNVDNARRRMLTAVWQSGYSTALFNIWQVFYDFGDSSP